MQKFYSTQICSIWFSLMMVLVGCSAEDTSSSLVPEDKKPAQSESQADLDWAALLAGNGPLSPLSGESLDEHLLRGLDTNSQLYREKGQEFWNNHPTDDRRYIWLVTTVGMPPSYAEDRTEWVAESLSIGPNSAPVDEGKLADWNNSYVAMRADFMERFSDTPQARRTLWSTELRQKIIGMRDARARGEFVDTTDEVLADILEFARSFPEKETSDDENAHAWHTESLITLAIGRDDFLVTDTESKDAFLERWLLTGSSYARYRVNMIREEGGFRSPVRAASESNDRLNELCSAPACRDWESTINGVPDAYVYSALLHSVPLFTSLNVPASHVDYGLFVHDKLKGSYRYLLLGFRNWDRMSAVDRVEWYSWAAHVVAVPVSLNISQYTFDGLVRPSMRDHPDRIEWELHNQIYERFYALGRNLVDDETLDEALRARVASSTLYSRLLLLDLEWSEGIDSARRLKEIVLQGVNDLNRFGHVEQFEYSFEYLLSLLTLPSSRFSGEDGLAIQDHSKLLVELSDSPNERIRNFAIAALDPVELVSGAPVAIRAMTMEGEPFDTTELHGKIVLIDHWDTNCGPCISAMPKIHDIYTVYKDKGFEVVSIAYDGDSERRAIERYRREMGLTWMTLSGEGLWGEVAIRYGYNGYPQYMLLDRKGRFFAGTEEVAHGDNLEALLSEIEAAEGSFD